MLSHCSFTLHLAVSLQLVALHAEFADSPQVEVRVRLLYTHITRALHHVVTL